MKFTTRTRSYGDRCEENSARLQRLERVRGFVADEVGALRQRLSNLHEHRAEAGERVSELRAPRALNRGELLLAAPEADEARADAEDDGEARGDLARARLEEGAQLRLVEFAAEGVVRVARRRQRRRALGRPLLLPPPLLLRVLLAPHLRDGQRGELLRRQRVEAAHATQQVPQAQSTTPRLKVIIVVVVERRGRRRRVDVRRLDRGRAVVAAVAVAGLGALRDASSASGRRRRGEAHATAPAFVRVG